MKINKSQAEAILNLIAEAYELEYIQPDGSLHLFNKITSKEDIVDLINQAKAITNA